MDARQHLTRLVGRTIETLTGRPNRILDVRGDQVIVGTNKSPAGEPVPLRWVQTAMDRLTSEGEVEISVASVGYRSAFVGAVLLTIPGAQKRFNPLRVTLQDEPR